MQVETTICLSCPSCLPESVDTAGEGESVGCLGRITYPIEGQFEKFLADRVQLALDTIDSVDQPRLLRILIDAESPFDGEATKELTPFGNVTGHVLDLSLDYDVDLFIEELDDYLSGEIDFMVNAAGFFKVKAFNETSVSDYDALLDLNRGFFFITQEVAKKMGTTGGGATNPRPEQRL